MTRLSGCRMRSPGSTVPLSRPASDRSPEERLVAVLRQADRDRAYGMFRELRDDFLGRAGGPGAVILAARRIHARQLISANAIIYIAACFFGPLTLRGRQSDPELCRLLDEVSELTKADEDERSNEYVDEARPAVVALWEAFESRTRALKPQRMREAGCGGLARLWEKDPAKFRRRVRRGGIELWGAELVFDDLVEELFLGE